MRVDFYLLNDSQPESRWLTTCRLLEKAYRRGHTAFVYCENKKDAELLDELLWTYKQDSFVPHNLQGEGPEPPPAVQMGYGGEPKGFNDILINIASTIPPFHIRFRRIIEIVLSNDADKTISRKHYRSYRANGYELFTHTIESITE